MVGRVVVHLGLPKTATTYLQTIFWAHRELLAEHGVLVPGHERRDHLWASRVVREERQASAPERHRTAWRRLVDELAASDAPTGLVSHEFFAAAGPAQVRRMVADLAPAPVHVVVTAREPLGLFTASWQESLKNGSTTPMHEYGRTESRSSTDIWNWRTLDLRLVLQRWGRAVPPERTHVVVLDPTAPREAVWHRFAEVLGLPAEAAGAVDLSTSFANSSMGVAQAEALRRVNGRLVGFEKAFDRGVWIRSFLADDRLVPQGGERFWPEPDQVEDCRARGHAAVALLEGAAYDVVGDLAHLRVPDELEPRRRPASVTDAEVAEVTVDLVATMLGDVRRLSDEARRAREDGEDGSTPLLPQVAGRAARAARALRGGLSRDR